MEEQPADMETVAQETPSLLDRIRERYLKNLQILSECILANRYISITPTPKQAEFLANPKKEVFFGGAAGGGKSAALLAAALMYVDEPDYSAIIFRKTFTDLSLPGALMEMSKEWLSNTPAHWNELKKLWTFPSGATLSFGYLDTANAKYRYQGSAFHTILIDELTQIDELSYRYLFSRLRKRTNSEIPLRMLSASNPAQKAEGQWVYDRFIQDSKPVHLTDHNNGKRYTLYHEKHGTTQMDMHEQRAFIPALLTDNPYLDESYEDSLNQLDYVTREQLLHGRWLVRLDGGIFQQDWFSQYYDPSDPPKYEETVISCDIAMKDNQTADYSCFESWGRLGANYYLIDLVRGKWQYPKLKAEFKKFCDRRPNTDILRKIIEDKAAGISLIQDLKDTVPGVIPFNPGAKSKAERAKLVSPIVEARQVYLPLHRVWTRDFIDECVSFDGTGKSHDDQIDAMSQALIKMKKSSQKFYIGTL